MPATTRANPIAREIGERINALRKERGLEISELAQKLGYSESAIKQIQNGQNATQFAKLRELCEALGTTPNVILGYDQAPVILQPTDRLNEVLLTAAIEAVLIDLALPEHEAEYAAKAIVQASREAPIAGLDPEASARAVAVARSRLGRRGKSQ